MKLAMKLTMEGVVKALRMRVHAITEETEQREFAVRMRRQRLRNGRHTRKAQRIPEDRDDRAGA